MRQWVRNGIASSGRTATDGDSRWDGLELGRPDEAVMVGGLASGFELLVVGEKGTAAKSFGLVAVEVVQVRRRAMRMYVWFGRILLRYFL